MSYNQHFYSTFQNNHPIPNFSVPPPAFPVPFQKVQITDEEIIKNMESRVKNISLKRPNRIQISQVVEQLRKIITIMNYLREKEEFLRTNIEHPDWDSTFDDVNKNKDQLNILMSNINDDFLNKAKLALAQRASKRLRLKRLKIERRRDLIELKKKQEEMSMNIDAYLQKIKDDVEKIKQEEQSKIAADTILREVLKKKSDAKKCLLKLDALLKLRKARENTAKGRGASVSENDALVFEDNIEKLKSLWKERLNNYETEECNLRKMLTTDSANEDQPKEHKIVETLNQWRGYLFGSMDMPQREFDNVEKFIDRRSTWDQYISNEGSSLPVGWVVPP